MNVEKRYCQNRVQKRKKKMKRYKVCALEEERQFKLNRFVKDVSRFVEEKKNMNNYENHNENIVIEPENIQIDCIKNVQNQINTKFQAKKGLFQNGIQTKFYTKGYQGCKDVTARLDENLYKIISLASKNKDHCSHSYGFPTTHCTTANSLAKGADQSISRCSKDLKFQAIKETTPLLVSLSPDVIHEDICLNNSQNRVINNINEEHNSKPLYELDSKLYPEFTRIVTVSSSQSKSIHFKTKSYGYDVKKKLLEIYRQGKRDRVEEFSCSTDVQKSSVATSPLQIPSTPDTDHSQLNFSHIHFTDRPLKSTQQFLEETIPGPVLSCKTVEDSPEHQWDSSIQSPFQNNYPESICPDSLRNLEYLHPPHTNNPTLVFSPDAAFTEVTLDGGGDRLHSKQLNNFSLSYLDEDSPQLQYFTRRMF